MKTDPKPALLDAYPERLMTATEAMAHLDLSRDGFYQLVRSGVIPRRADGKFDSGDIRQAYFAHLEGLTKQRASSSVRRLTRERTRQVRMKADALAMKNQKRRQELVPRNQVVEEYASDLEAMRATLMTIPGRMGEEFAAMTPQGAAARVAELIDDALLAMRAADEVVAKVQANQIGSTEGSE